MIGLLAHEMLRLGVGFVENGDPCALVGAIDKDFDADDFVFFVYEFENANFGAVADRDGFKNIFGDAVF